MRRRSFLITAAALAAAGPALAADDDPIAVVREIYRITIDNLDRVDRGQKMGPPVWRPPNRDRFFAQRLARLFAADDRRQEGRLDFDPISDSQDPKITELAFVQESRAGQKAVVVAQFKNRGEPKRIEYEMVLERGAWRVADIRARGKDGWVLSRILTGK